MYFSTDTLPRLGVGWLLVEHTSPGRVDARVLEHSALVYDGPELRLYRLGSAHSPGWPRSTPLVLSVDAVVLALALGAVQFSWGVRRRSREEA